MRFYMEDPDNEERLLKIPQHVVDRIREDEQRKTLYRYPFNVHRVRRAALRDAVNVGRTALPINIDPGVPGLDPTERKAFQIGARYGAAKAVAAIEALRGGEQ